MNWRLIDKSKAVQPAAGTYRDWKRQLREEGYGQCVYCAIEEARFGGYRNFHVEHYRPKKHFAELVNTITNLFYICAICNSFKGSDWPAEPLPDLSNPSYPDPSKFDYGQFLSTNDDCWAESNTIAGRYVIERLYLNRPQLLMARSVDNVLSSIQAATSEIIAISKNPGFALEASVARLLCDAIDVLARLVYVAPYEPDDVAR